MKKVRVCIEEVVRQEFETNISNTDDLDKIYDEIRDKYKNCELVIDNPGLVGVYGIVYDGDTEYALGNLDIH